MEYFFPVEQQHNSERKTLQRSSAAWQCYCLKGEKANNAPKNLIKNEKKKKICPIIYDTTGYIIIYKLY